MLIALADYVVHKDQGEVVSHLDGSAIPGGEYVQFNPTPRLNSGRCCRLSQARAGSQLTAIEPP
jgi:hypothetical protein